MYTNKVISLMSKKNKKLFFINFFLTIFLTFLESISLISIVILFEPIINLEQNSNFDYLKNIFFIDFSKISIDKIIYLFLGLFILKNLFSLIIKFFQLSYFNNFLLNLNKKMFSKTLNLDYLQFIKNNHSFYLRNNTTEINMVRKYLQELTNFFTETLLILILLILAFVNVDEKLKILVLFFTLIFAGYFIYFNLKKLITKLAKKRVEDRLSMLRTYQEVLSFFIENFFSHNKKFFYHHQRKHFKSLYNNNLKLSFLGILPKHLLEIFLIILIVIFLKTSNFGIDSSNFFIIIATLRILPSLNNLMRHIQILRGQRPSLDLVFNFLNNSYEINSVENQNFKKNIFNQIKFENLNFNYSESRNLIKNLSFQINVNEKLGIYGQSGSGKSTLIKIIGGLIKTKTGKIFLDNKEIKILKNYLKISYLSQDIFLFDGSIKDNIVLDTLYDEKKFQKAIEDVNLKDFIMNQKNKSNSFINAKSSNISGGERQRIAIARSLFSDSDLLIFDEFTNSLDEENERRIFELIKKLNKTCIIISHNKNILKETCDGLIELG